MDKPIPSVMIRGERHTGTNFLEAILAANFRRSSQDVDAALAAAARAGI